MALILARGRRRDRFGQCLLAFDDLPHASRGAAGHAIAAALRGRAALRARRAAADHELSAAARRLLDRHDPRAASMR